MFACLFQPTCQQRLFEAAPRAVEVSLPVERGRTGASLEALAREFSPRVQVHQGSVVSLDIGGLGRLLGTPAEIGDELRRAAADRGLHPHIGIAPTRTAALLLALARAGVTVVPPGGERDGGGAAPARHPAAASAPGPMCRAPAVPTWRRDRRWPTGSSAGA